MASSSGKNSLQGSVLFCDWGSLYQSNDESQLWNDFTVGNGPESDIPSKMISVTGPPLIDPKSSQLSHSMSGLSMNFTYEWAMRYEHCASQRGEHLVQVVANDRTVEKSERLPSLFEGIPSNKLHVYIDFLLVYSPSIDFRNWYAAFKRFSDHP